MTDLGERTLKCYLLHTGSIADESEFEDWYQQRHRRLAEELEYKSTLSEAMPTRPLWPVKPWRMGDLLTRGWSYQARIFPVALAAAYDSLETGMTVHPFCSKAFNIAAV